MIEFRDILYGHIELPDWIGPFLKLPEFLRLRGIRLSNIDSFQFKDFNGPTRWEHSVAVAYLAQKCAKLKNLNQKDSVILTIGALLHDVATPPFAHTLEYVLENFDHEIESKRLLSSNQSEDFKPDTPVFMSELPQFSSAIRNLNRFLKLSISQDEIADVVIGEGPLGFLVHGAIDLDNADNVIRASAFLGIDIDKNLPLKIVEWLANQEHMPVELQKIEAPEIKQWLMYRNKLYSEFYFSNEEEIARQAFLQHILRRAVQSNFPRQALIWNTDESLLSVLSSYNEDNQNKYRISLEQLISRYRLLENPVEIARIDIESRDILDMLSLPKATSWLEDQLSTPYFEAMSIANIKRFDDKMVRNGLFPAPLGYLCIFKLGQDIKYEYLPEWLKNEIPVSVQRNKIPECISSTISKLLSKWEKERLWNTMTSSKKSCIISNLKHCGNWSFSLTRNDNLHEYPSTFVYAIPANLINSLCLKGELIIDPFGGTGQTAVEAIKYGCEVITSDTNAFATLCSRVKLTYLSPAQRKKLRNISKSNLLGFNPSTAPKIDNLEKWFHPRTLDELCKIWNFIRHQRDENVKQFLQLAFSSILNSCTARKGRHHTYFADNTPLPTELSRPRQEDAVSLFVSKIDNNITILERLYAFMEKDGHNAEIELKKAKVLQVDATKATPENYGIKPNSAAAIITSPPYLCMADYTFGLRLSYNWILPNKLETDFSSEIGARRRRSKSNIVEEYFSDLEKFAINATKIIRPEGFLALVFGSPTAKAFEKIDIYKKFDSILEKNGFKLIWKQNRTLHHQRGHSCIEKERVSVHLLD